MRGGWEGDDRGAIKPHNVPLQEEDLARYELVGVVEEVLFRMGDGATAEEFARTIIITGTFCSAESLLYSYSATALAAVTSTQSACRLGTYQIELARSGPMLEFN